MRFDRESYRKLYVTESAEHRLMSLFARGLRDHLLRYAMEDGTLLPNTINPADDLCRVLGAAGSERRLVAQAVEELRRVGYLTLERSRLSITHYVEAQESRTPGALRQQRYRDSHRNVTPGVTRDADSNVTRDVTSNRRDETRRDIADESAGARDGVGSSDSPNEPEPKLTVCPLNLAEVAEKTGIVRDFAERYRVDPKQLHPIVHEFVAHWTIGGGMGRKELNWPRKLRSRLKDACEKPGGLAAPGAVEHSARKPQRTRGGRPEAFGALVADYVPTEQVPYHQPWRPKS
jgi:hypothetical protein